MNIQEVKSKICVGGNYYVGCIGYSRYDTTEPLPKVRARCNKNIADTAIPIVWINLNGGKGLILYCPTCKSYFTMNYSSYKHQYIGGKNMHGDFIPPNGEIPVHLKKKYAKIAEEHQDSLGEHFGYSPEEFKKMRTEWKKESDARLAQHDKDTEIRRNEEKTNKALEEVSEKSKLIKEGIIVYNKSAGCLVDTRTGKVVTL